MAYEFPTVQFSCGSSHCCCYPMVQFYKFQSLLNSPNMGGVFFVYTDNNNKLTKKKVKWEI